jgi:hypothetical protein
MSLEFLQDATNVILLGPSGVGKSMLARNLAHQALIAGHTVLFTSAGALLGELAALDSDSALRRRLRHYAAPRLLIVDLCGVRSDVEYGSEAAGMRHNGLLHRQVEADHLARAHHRPRLMDVGTFDGKYAADGLVGVALGQRAGLGPARTARQSAPIAGVKDDVDVLLDFEDLARHGGRQGGGLADHVMGTASG